MIRLNLPREPYWLPLDGLTLRLKVRPISTAVMDAAQARAVAMSAEIALQRRALREAGQDAGHLPDLDDPVVRQGVGETVALKALARSVIIDWKGVFQADGVTPAAVTDDTVNQLMDIWPVARAFRAQYVSVKTVLDAEKNASTPAPSGTGAAGRDTADSAMPTGCPVPAASEDQTESAAPTTNMPH